MMYFFVVPMIFLSVCAHGHMTPVRDLFEEERIEAHSLASTSALPEHAQEACQTRPSPKEQEEFEALKAWHERSGTFQPEDLMSIASFVEKIAYLQEQKAYFELDWACAVW